MNKTVEQLRHWALNPPATIYDEESLTTLKLAARVAAKLNELIQAFQDLSRGTANALEEFETETIPEEVSTQIQTHIDNGSFDKAIDLYAGELIARLNNLFNNTTAEKDVEIIDARMDHRGYMTEQAWPSLGQMLRFWLNELEDNLNCLITWQTAPVEIKSKMILGYVDTEGQFIKKDLETHRCATVEVVPGQRFRIKNIYGFAMPSFVVQDKDHYVVMLGDTSEGKAEANYDRVITMPANAAYLIVNSMNGYFAGVQEVIGVNSNALDGEYISNALKGVMCGVQKRSTVPGKKLLTAHALKNGEIVALESGDTGHRVGRYNVEEGRAYTVNTACSFGCNPFVFLNKAGSIIDRLEVAPEETEKKYAVTVRAPIGAVEMLVYFTTGYNAVLMVDDGCKVEVPTPTAPGLDWSGINWHCIGDSLTEVNDRSDKRYYDFVREKTGIRVTVDGIGGTGYSRGNDINKSFVDRAATIPAQTDVVTIFGSGNDLTSLGETVISVNPTWEKKSFMSDGKVASSSASTASEPVDVVAGDVVSYKTETASDAAFSCVVYNANGDVVATFTGYCNTITIPADGDTIRLGRLNSATTVTATITRSGLPLGEVTDNGYTLCGLVNQTIDAIYSTHPVVVLGVVSPCPWDTYPVTQEGNMMEQYTEALRSVCRRRGIPFLDLYHESGLRPWDENYRAVAYTKDDGAGVHPDETGHKILSAHFYKFLSGLVGTF